MLYGEDVTHVHETGHTDFAREAAPGIVARLAGAGLSGGLVVELGCGTGVTARALVDAGHEVVGVDISAEMLAIARDRAPEATFVRASLTNFEIPACAAVLAISEVFTYGDQPVDEVFGRVQAALKPGGLLLFDVVVPGAPGSRRLWRERDDWVMCVETTEDHDAMRLTRAITVFRRDGDAWRRADETHDVRLFDPLDVLARLSRAGFQARGLPGYGEGHTFPPGVAGFEAVKMG